VTLFLLDVLTKSIVSEYSFSYYQIFATT